MSDENISLAPLKVGMLGLSIDAIDQGKWGYVYLPLGNRDATFAGGRVWVRIKVRAIEPIRAERDIIIANAQGEVKEHTPVELSYQSRSGPYQRVTEDFPLPITAGSKSITHTTIEATAAGNTTIVEPSSSSKRIRVHYFSISNKHTTLVDVGMRFRTDGTIKHRFGLAADGGTVNANLIDCNWEGDVGEILYANLVAAYAGGVYFNVGYTFED